MPLTPSLTELARMRAEVERTLPETVELWRPTPVDDGSGGFTNTWNRIGRYAASIRNRTADPREVIQGERPTAVTSWQVRLPFDAVPKPQDLILRVLQSVATMTDDEMKTHRTAGEALEVTDADEIKSTKTSVLVNGYRVT
jgi:hypothetical protein